MMLDKHPLWDQINSHIEVKIDFDIFCNDSLLSIWILFISKTKSVYYFKMHWQWLREAYINIVSETFSLFTMRYYKKSKHKSINITNKIF